MKFHRSCVETLNETTFLICFDSEMDLTRKLYVIVAEVVPNHQKSWLNIEFSVVWPNIKYLVHS